jgi:hypothetical protein
MKREQTTTRLVLENIPQETRDKRRVYFEREYPGHVPLFVQYGHDMMIHRYVIPRDSSFGHFLIAFRRKIQLKASDSLMALVEKQGHDDDIIKSFQVSSHKTIGELADEYLNRDGYLYINMATEHTFG